MHRLQVRRRFQDRMAIAAIDVPPIGSRETDRIFAREDIGELQRDRLLGGEDEPLIQVLERKRQRSSRRFLRWLAIRRRKGDGADTGKKTEFYLHRDVERS